MSLVERGDFDAELPDADPHPVVIVSRPEAILYRTNVTVVLVTSTVRGHAAEIELDESHGLDHLSVANCDEIYTIPKRSLRRRRGHLPLQDLERLNSALRLALGL